MICFHKIQRHNESRVFCPAFLKSSAKRTVYHKEVRSLNLGSASYIHRLIGFHKVKYGLSVNNVVQLALA